jgi:hypothetical protein
MPFHFLLLKEFLQKQNENKKPSQTENESRHSAWFLQRFLNSQVAIISTAMT